MIIVYQTHPKMLRSEGLLRSPENPWEIHWWSQLRDRQTLWAVGDPTWIAHRTMWLDGLPCGPRETVGRGKWDMAVSSLLCSSRHLLHCEHDYLIQAQHPAFSQPHTDLGLSFMAIPNFLGCSMVTRPIVFKSSSWTLMSFILVA